MERSKKRPYALSTSRTLALLLHYFVGYSFIYRIIASQLTILIKPGAMYILPSIQLGMYALVVFVTVALAWPSIKHSYHRFIEQWYKNINLIIVLCVISFIVNISLSLLVSYVTSTTGSNNQNLIEQSSTMMPFLTILSTCLVAPIVEECVFRSGLFAFIRKKFNFFLAALLSSVFFASLHFSEALFTGNFNDLSYLIVYTAIGFVFAYAYEKSDSVMVSGSIHFLNNAMAMLQMML